MKSAVSAIYAVIALARRLSKHHNPRYSFAREIFVDAERGSDVTEQLNEIYADERSDFNNVLSEIQFRSLSFEGW